MPIRDMLDVIHYFFEEDMNYTSSEQAEARSKTRTSLYADLYGTTYKYAMKTSNSTSQMKPEDYETEDGPSMADIKPFDPKQEPVRAYTPPTDFDPTSSNPFGNGIDAPMR